MGLDKSEFVYYTVLKSYNTDTKPKPRGHCMSKMTIEVDMEKLTEKGRDALGILINEISKSSSPVVESDTINTMADKLYARFARKASMRGVLDALLDSKGGILTYPEVCEASGHKKGGSGLAGVMSSMTRNWQRYGGKGRFHRWDEAGGEGWAYRLVDAGMLEPFRKARERFKKHVLHIPVTH